MHSSVLNIVEDLEIQANQSTQHLSVTHLRFLKYLPPIEKDLLASKCIQWNWNIGSSKVLCFLQAANILSMTQYMLKKQSENAEEAQLIFNDLLETEYNLLGDLIRHLNNNDATALIVTEIVTEGLQRLIADLSQDTNALSKNYFTLLKENVPDVYITELISMHLRLFLSTTKKSSVTEAIRNQQVWNQEFTNDENSILHAIVSDVIGEDNRNKVFSKILELSSTHDFKCWKFCLLFIRKTVRNLESEGELNAFRNTVKAFIKSTFQKARISKNENTFFHMMLIARQICYCSEKILGSYAVWFKATFGDLKYSLKGEEFTNVIQTLINMIEHESDKDIIQLHVNTTIPAPTFCNHIVLTYKQMLRSKLELYQ